MPADLDAKDPVRFNEENIAKAILTAGHIHTIGMCVSVSRGW